MKEIYLTRHGQTDFNKAGIVQGSGVDAPLNEFGRQQASEFYSAYGHIEFDKVYISELQRTRQSVARFLEKHPYEVRSEINEISWGIYEGKKIGQVDREAFRELVKSWDNGHYDKGVPEGESPLEVYRRMIPFRLDLIKRTEDECILICMHGRAMRIFLCLLLNMPLTEMHRFGHHNLGLYHLQMDQEGLVNVLKSDDTSHLSS